MKPTKEQKSRRCYPFKFTYNGRKSWFYLCDDGASFHQTGANNQQDVYGLRIATLIKALKKCGYIALLLLLPAVVEAKEVVIPYNDFLTMVSVTEHKDKLIKQCTAEREILVKLNDENGTIKRLNAQQVEALSKEIQEHEKLGETQEQIAKALEAELRGEKRLSRYKSEAFWLGVLAVGLWVMN